MGNEILKRFQVLFTDWQEEYLRYISKKHNYSFSETLRIILSEGILYVISLLSPEYKSEISKEELSKIIKNVARINSTEAERHKFISTVHFEARKAVRYRLGKVRKQKKKNKS